MTKVIAGKPILAGTRIPVELILKMLSHGIQEGEILRDYPKLQAEDTRAGLAYAAQVLALEEIEPMIVPAWVSPVRSNVYESIGRAYARCLQEAGFDTLSVGDIFPQTGNNEILDFVLNQPVNDDPDIYST